MLVRALKATRSWGVRPSDFWQVWSSRDRALALGLLALEEETGSNGFLRSFEEDPENDGYFEAVPSVNYASKAIDTWLKDNGDKAGPGTVVRVRYNKPNEEDWK